MNNFLLLGFIYIVVEKQCKRKYKINKGKITIIKMMHIKYIVYVNNINRAITLIN